MAERKSFLLRLPPDLHKELELWARDDLRSLNAQIEFLLRRAVSAERRPLPPSAEPGGEDEAAPGAQSSPGRPEQSA